MILLLRLSPVVSDISKPPPLPGPPLTPPSTRLVEIPEDVLANLLKGTGQSVEEFLQANRSRIQTGRDFQKRARAAKWSRMWLAASTLFCIVSFITGRDVEDAISALLLGSMTCVEFKVHDWFLEGDLRGAIYGYWNQTLFAVLFLVYGAYHYFGPAAPQAATDLLDASYTPVILQLSKIFYATVGIAGAIGQYVLALYYKRSLRRN
jgi:hypothetical protein